MAPCEVALFRRFGGLTLAQHGSLGRALLRSLAWWALVRWTDAGVQLWTIGRRRVCVLCALGGQTHGKRDGKCYKELPQREGLKTVAQA